MTLLSGSHNHGAEKTDGETHQHNHAHGKNCKCDVSSDSHHVHDHAKSCHVSSAHKHSCSSNTMVTRRDKAGKALAVEDNVTFCSNKKCGVDPLGHHHQHAIDTEKKNCIEESCSQKVLECSACDEACNCCEPALTPMACQQEECKDIEAQVCVNEMSLAEESSKSDLSCGHEAECCGEIHKEELNQNVCSSGHVHYHDHRH